MFAVIYQGYLKEGKEEAYRQSWKEVASYFIHYRGALGSCLHKGKEGLWVAYSKWPTKAARDASWPVTIDAPEKIQKAIATILECIDDKRKIDNIEMDVEVDLF